MVQVCFFGVLIRSPHKYREVLSPGFPLPSWLWERVKAQQPLLASGWHGKFSTLNCNCTNPDEFLRCGSWWPSHSGDLFPFELGKLRWSHWVCKFELARSSFVIVVWFLLKSTSRYRARMQEMLLMRMLCRGCWGAVWRNWHRHLESSAL